MAPAALDRQQFVAADDLIRLKRIVLAQGVLGCFMAKPNDDYAGSGMHLHVSLNDDQDRNVFCRRA